MSFKSLGFGSFHLNSIKVAKDSAMASDGDFFCLLLPFDCTDMAAEAFFFYQ